MKKNKPLIIAILSAFLLTGCSLFTPAEEGDGFDPYSHSQWIDGLCYSYSTVTNEATFVGLNGIPNGFTRDKVEILSNFRGYPVTSIGWKALQGATIKEVIVPSGVKHIGYAAFEGHIDKITLPDGIEELEDYALPCGDSDWAPEYYLPSSIKKVGKHSVGYTTNINEVPSSLEEMGEWAFRATHFEEVSFPSTITSIPKYAFYGITAKTINIGDQITSLGEGSFENMLGVESLYIGSGIEEIPERCFKTDMYEGSIAITGASGVRRILKEAFYGVFTDLFPYSNVLTRIEDKALIYVKNRDFPESLTDVHHDAFMSRPTAGSAGHIPTRMRYFAPSLFQGVVLDATEVYLDAWYYGEGAFSGTNLTSVTMTDYVQTLEDGLFYNCNNLTSFRFLGTKSEFLAVYKNCTGMFKYTKVDTIKCSDGDLNPNQ